MSAPSLSPDEVFSSARVTDYSFAERIFPTDHPQRLHHDNYDEWLSTSFKAKKGGVVVYGMSKTGKTSMVEAAFRDLGEKPIILFGKDLHSVEAFYKSLADHLKFGNSWSQTDERGDSSEISGTVATPPASVSSTISNSESNSRSTSGEFSTSVKILEKLYETRRPLLIDDFHHCPDDVAKDISIELKPMAREMLIVLIAIPSKSFIPVRGTIDNGGRFKQFEIGFWTRSELEQIGQKGFPFLGYTESAKDLARLISEFTFGSPQLMQELCLAASRYLLKNKISDEAAVHTVYSVLSPLCKMVAQENRPANFTSFVTGKNSKGKPRKSYNLLSPPNEIQPTDRFDLYGIGLLSLKSAAELGERRHNHQQLLEQVRPWDCTPTYTMDQLSRTMRNLSALAEETRGNLDPVIAVSDLGNQRSNFEVDILDPFLSFYLAYGNWIKEALLQE